MGDKSYAILTSAVSKMRLNGTPIDRKSTLMFCVGKQIQTYLRSGIYIALNVRFMKAKKLTQCKLRISLALLPGNNTNSLHIPLQLEAAH